MTKAVERLNSQFDVGFVGEIYMLIVKFNI